MGRESKDLKLANPTLVNLTGLLIAIFLFATYVYLYQLAPLEEPWNDAALNLITSFSALLAAGVATAIYLHYHPEDLPRKVWVNLAIGSWFWFLGDTLWGILAYQVIEVPTPSIADPAWIIGIAFFTIAFYYQYVIIFPVQKQRILAITISAWLVAMIVPAVALLSAGAFGWGAYVDYYYPASEILIGIAGIALVVAFQGGALVRPWIGMVVFSISDFFYAWAEQFGLYEWSSANNSMLTLAIDVSYLAAYLILAFGFLGHWILIKYGLREKK